MRRCEYCLEYKAILAPATKSKTQLYPDGRKLDWQFVCSECNQNRALWDQQRNVEKFQLAEQRRQWHLDVAERNAQKRATIEANKRERDLARMATLEVELATLEAELEALRKKYFSQT